MKADPTIQRTTATIPHTKGLAKMVSRRDPPMESRIPILFYFLPFSLPKQMKIGLLPLKD